MRLRTRNDSPSGIHRDQLDRITPTLALRLLPVPDIGNARFSDTQKWTERGWHRILYRFSPTDYNGL